MQPRLIFRHHIYPPEWIGAEADRVRAGLHQIGCEPGDRVAAFLRNGPAYVVLAQACRQAGVLLVSINWHYKGEETRHILADCGARAIFIHEDLVAQVRDGFTEGLAVIDVPADEGTEAAAASAARWTTFGDGADEVPAQRPLVHCTIPYTSGTTGKPKGVLRLPVDPLRRTAIDRELNEVLRTVYGMDRHATVMLCAPLYHSATMSYAQYASAAGATLLLEPSFDAAATLRLIQEHRVSHAYMVPTMFRRMLALPGTVRQRFDPSSLRHITSTGSPCPDDLKRAMIDWFGPVVTEGYGSSETGYVTFIDASTWLERPGSVGRALGRASIRIVDGSGQALPTGQTGIIYVKQPAMPDFTYLNHAPSRESMGLDGMVTLGDIGYLDGDGFLYICDRQSDMVISGGANIYPAEIEAALQTMSGVADCAVFGIPDTEYGEALAAAVQLDAGSTLDAAQVQGYLRARLANFKVPRLITFHAVLPREETGKIFKRKLREPYWQGVDRQI
jgi:long-chain acyl-CoA synthetase